MAIKLHMTPLAFVLVLGCELGTQAGGGGPVDTGYGDAVVGDAIPEGDGCLFYNVYTTDRHRAPKDVFWEGDLVFFNFSVENRCAYDAEFISYTQCLFNYKLTTWASGRTWGPGENDDHLLECYDEAESTIIPAYSRKTEWIGDHGPGASRWWPDAYTYETGMGLLAPSFDRYYTVIE
jgi:hypothetical protein